MLFAKKKKNDKNRKTLYHPHQYKVKASIPLILLVVAVILLMLVAARFLNLGMHWQTSRMQVEQDPLTANTMSSIDYHFEGLAGYNAVMKKYFDPKRTPSKKPIIVASYFDPAHQEAFIINNKGASIFVNLGKLTVYAKKGITSIHLYPTEIMEIWEPKQKAVVMYYGSTLFPAIYHKFAEYTAERDGGKVGKVSLIRNKVIETFYLQIPYYIYFYFPLISILVLISRYGGTFCIAFFYYLEIYLLFDYKMVIFSVPFSWLLKPLGLEISHQIIALIAILLVIIFVVLGFVGVFTRRKDQPVEMTFTVWAKGFLIFFLLLPFFLRF
ncbi:MAG: hypothetical protein GY765_28955 [bacterium]|nr:hypothetical protein [bacterium]